MVTRDLLVGIGIGAGLAFIADPQAGRRRRALARDQVIRASRKTRDALDATARDVGNRTTGIISAARGRWTQPRVEDRRLLERARATLGRYCSHPRAIDVDVADGCITLRGPILAAEVANVVGAIRSVPGVATVANQLEVHETPEGVPSLQGEGRIPGRTLDILQRNWAPATQALVTAAGVAATAVCVAAYARR